MVTDAKKGTMEILIHTVNDTRIAEITSDSILIHSPEEGLDLLGNISSEFDKMIIHERCITPDF